MNSFISRKHKSDRKGLRILCLIAMAISFFGCLFNEDRISRGSVVENEIVGTIRTSDGLPSIGARIQLYAADSGKASEKDAFLETQTDSTGQYHFRQVTDGVYSLIGKHDTLLAFHDSIQVKPIKGGPKQLFNLTPDTLRATGAITVQVILKPGDDASTISGFVLGTAFSSHAQNNGDLSMQGMPAGRLRIRFTSSLAGYRPLEVAVNVAPGNTTAAGVLVLPF